MSFNQQNFELRSVCRFHGSEAGLISISHFTNLAYSFKHAITISIRISHFMCAWGRSGAVNHSHFLVSLSDAEVVKAVQFLISFLKLIKIQPKLDSELSLALRLEARQSLCWPRPHTVVSSKRPPWWHLLAVINSIIWKDWNVVERTTLCLTWENAFGAQISDKIHCKTQKCTPFI